MLGGFIWSDVLVMIAGVIAGAIAAATGFGIATDGVRAIEHLVCIAAHLVKHSGVCERERLAIYVIQPPRERDWLLDMRRRGTFITEQPECVRLAALKRLERDSIVQALQQANGRCGGYRRQLWLRTFTIERLEIHRP